MIPWQLWQLETGSMTKEGSRGDPGAVLLQMLGPTANQPDPRAVTALDESDWAWVETTIRQQGLGPILRWRLLARKSPLPLPTGFLERLDHRHRAALMAALRRQRDLVQTIGLLKAIGIPTVALKGAYLAFHVYPDPALRTMSDLDVLVPEPQALAAFAQLLDNGFERDNAVRGDARAHLRLRKHLPPLRAPGGTLIELHHRLSEWSNPLAPAGEGAGTSATGTPRQGVDLARVDGYWERTRSHRIAGTDIAYPDPTDLLLHLCVHTAYDDRFFGARILFDLDFLLAQIDPDWGRFWATAETGGWTRGCALLLRLQQTLFNTAGIVWSDPNPAAEVSESFLRELGSLLLSDRHLGRRGRMSDDSWAAHSGIGTLGLALRRCFDPPDKIAALYPVDPDSWWVYAYYPRHWSRLVTRRLPQYLRARRSERVVTLEQRRAGVEAWMRGP